MHAWKPRSPRWFGLCLTCNVQRIPCLAGAASKVRINELSRREGNVTARPVGRHGSDGSGSSSRIVGGGRRRTDATATCEPASPDGGQSARDKGCPDAEGHLLPRLHPIPGGVRPVVLLRAADAPAPG